MRDQWQICITHRTISNSLSVLADIFPDKPELVCFNGALEKDVVVTTGAIRRAKL